jgi:hypothetical protein
MSLTNITLTEMYVMEYPDVLPVLLFCRQKQA